MKKNFTLTLSKLHVTSEMSEDLRKIKSSFESLGIQLSYSELTRMALSDYINRFKSGALSLNISMQSK